jgi:hypothetical protein
MKKQIFIASVLVALCFGSAMAFKTPGPVNGPLSALGNVSVLELSAKAADLVASAPANLREATTRQVIQAVNALSYPDIVVSAVASISQRTPEMAAVAAGAASALNPRETLRIAKATFDVAPSQSKQIISSLCREVPSAHTAIAQVALAQKSIPSSSILSGIEEGVPSLSPLIAQAKTYVKEDSLALLLNKADDLQYQQVKLAYDANEKIQKTPQSQTLASASNPVRSQGVNMATPSESSSQVFNSYALTPTGLSIGQPFKAVPPLLFVIDVSQTTILPPTQGRNYSAP